MGILCKEFLLSFLRQSVLITHDPWAKTSVDNPTKTLWFYGEEEKITWTTVNVTTLHEQWCLDIATPSRIQWLDKLASQNRLLEYYVISLLQFQIHLYWSMIIHRNFVSIVSLQYSNTEHFTITVTIQLYKWVLYCYIQNKDKCFGWCSVIGKLIRCW